jgi:hypothetical protein
MAMPPPGGQNRRPERAQLVESITAKGVGPNSGEIGVSLKEPHQSFWVFMDTPRDMFFSTLKTAFEAIWDSKTIKSYGRFESSNHYCY